MAGAVEDPALSPKVFLDMSGSGNGPWEIQRAQSLIVELVEQGVFHGQVLDLGCGIGDNAIYIATHANNVHITAIDLVLKAVDVAREKARQNNAKNIQFECINILDNPASSVLKKHSFDIVLDVAVFHVFSNDDRQRYINYLQYLIKPGGLYIQVSNSEKEPHQGGPRRMKKDELFALFSSTNGWTIESINDTQYETKSSSLWGSHMVAYLSFIRRNKNT